MKNQKFVHLDNQGNPWCIVSTEQMWGDFYVIKYNRPEKKLDETIWINLFQQAKEKSLDFGAKTIGVRVRQEYEPELIQKILIDFGFKKIARRIEYQCEVDKLLSDMGSPLTWHTANDLKWSEQKLADFTKEITSGALDINPNEKPEHFIQDWLKHNEFTCGMSCVSIGFLNNKPVALVVVQIEEKTGWSRISYMGLISEFRGQGLGKWAHRHGFQMMKSQGGKLYHGGTHTDNLPMRKLFEQHGCRVYTEMIEWEFN